MTLPPSLTRRHALLATRRTQRHDRALAQRNPLLAAWQHWQAPYLMEHLIRRTNLTQADYEEHIDQRMLAFMVRRKLVLRYAFAIPDDSVLRVLAAYSPIVELGAGSGYWAWLLRRDYGVDIVPYDLAPPSTRGNDWAFHREFVEVQEGGVAVLDDHPDRALFLCWPPMTEMASLAVARYQGPTVLYIGEGEGGCTADPAFFAALEADWTLVSEHALPQWDGIHDDLSVYTRKEGR